MVDLNTLADLMDEITELRMEDSADGLHRTFIQIDWFDWQPQPDPTAVALLALSFSDKTPEELEVPVPPPVVIA